MADWTDLVAAERIQLDREFADRIDASSFSRREWGLVMTAVEFEIENPEDPPSARVRADTSKVPAVLPALDGMGSGRPVGAAGAPTSGTGGVARRLRTSVASLTGPAGGRWSRALRRHGRRLAVTAASLAAGIGLGGEDERVAEIESLTDEYCERFQEKLEANGRWEAVCRRARAPGGAGPGLE